MDTRKRVILVSALRHLADDAREQRAHLAPDSLERQFLLGVDAAVQGFLHPELADARSPTWLEHESEAFRDGYLATIADVTAAMSCGGPPLRLPSPQQGAPR